MESQPQNPELGIILMTYTHVLHKVVHDLDSRVKDIPADLCFSGFPARKLQDTYLLLT